MYSVVGAQSYRATDVIVVQLRVRYGMLPDQEHISVDIRHFSEVGIVAEICTMKLGEPTSPNISAMFMLQLSGKMEAGQ